MRRKKVYFIVISFFIFFYFLKGHRVETAENQYNRAPSIIRRKEGLNFASQLVEEMDPLPSIEMESFTAIDFSYGN